MRLFYVVDGAVSSRDYEYTMDTAPPPPAPALTTPTPGTELGASTVTFEWVSNGTPVTVYALWFGSAQGTFDLGKSGVLEGSTTRFTKTGLPRDGRGLHVRLFYVVDGAVSSRDYEFAAADAL